MKETERSPGSPERILLVPSSGVGRRAESRVVASARQRWPRPRAIPSPLLKQLLAPVTTGAFMRDWFERAPLFLEASAARRAAHPALRAPLRELLRQAGPDYVGLRIFGATGEPVPREAGPQFLGGSPLARFVRERRGSLVLDGLQAHFSKYGDLAERLEDAFHFPVRINAYVTPQGQRTLPCHWDDHDVLVMQVSGTKTWNVYAPEVILPLRGQPGSHPRPGEPVLRARLRPGAVLYLPRGFPHQAIASSGTSFHLTIGLWAVSTFDLLAASVQEALRQMGGDPRFRRGVDLKRATAERRIALLCRGLMREFSAALRQQDHGLLWRSLHLGGAGGATDPARLAWVGRAESAIARGEHLGFLRTGRPLVIDREGWQERLRVVFRGGELLAPRRFDPALRNLERTGRLSTRQLRKDLDREEIGDLIGHLGRAGLIAPFETGGRT